MNTQYPLKLQFKKISLTNKISVMDGNGQLMAYAHQKLLKLKEQILLYADANKTQPIGEIRADKVIDYSPTYAYYDQNGQRIMSVVRNGGKSILKADYTVLDINQQPIYKVEEENAWVKMIDAFMPDLLSGLIFNPKYSVNDSAGNQVAQIVKERAFFEGAYTVNLINQADPNLTYLPMAVLAVTIRERFRG